MEIILETNKYLIGATKEKKYLEQSFKLRYEDLILAFDEKKQKNKTDYSTYDDFCEHIVCIDKETDEVVGSYRIATKESLKTKPFVSEEEYNIDNLKAKYKLLEASRAVVKKEYQNTMVMTFLWQAVINYAFDNDIDYLFGTASFKGVDPTPYTHVFSYLYYNFLIDEAIMPKATKNKFKLNMVPKDHIDMQIVKEKMPVILKGYCVINAKIAAEGYIDYDFNSVDVFVLLDIKNINPRVLKRFVKQKKTE
ncbi:MAG TPA: GNAT family N-acetyltransferase [Acholeplasma sp.]|nr:GNAT family N-acetyltransferase [Acholeplasma sp.]